MISAESSNGRRRKWELNFDVSKGTAMHFGNDISNLYIMLDLNDQILKMLEFITG